VDSQLKVAVHIRDLKKRVVFILRWLCTYPETLNIRFCDEEEMVNAHATFAGKNKVTDVLSFVPRPDDVATRDHLGDVLICLPVCLWQAKRTRRSLAKEVEQKVIHGIVHLKGLDHERDDHAFNIMKTLETALQKALNTACDDPSWITLG